MPWQPAGGCWSVAVQRSMRSKKLSSSWKTTRPSMPAGAAFSIATAKYNSTRLSWTAPRCGRAAWDVLSGCETRFVPRRKILSDSPHVYFVAEGAERFAEEHGIALCRNEDLIIPREVDAAPGISGAGCAGVKTNPALRIFAPTISHDTVGAVALDANGNIAAATSTGGTLNKAPGRLGDSSLIGCGCYADNQTASRVHHRMGRTDHEAGVGKVGG